MDLDILHEFVVLAQICNYQEAASKLMVSQSTLSKHISKLEDELGIQLFDRSKRSISLNNYGELFRDYAAQMCELAEKSTQALNELRNMNNSRLCVGFMTLHGQYGLMETLNEFSKLYPDIEVNMIEKSGDLLKHLLVLGKCDFVFAAESAGNIEFRTTPYKTDVLAAVLPKTHPLAVKSSVTLDELSTEKFIEHRMSYEMQIFGKLCSEHDFHPNNIASISYAPTVLRMIGQGAGISVMSKQIALSCNDFDVAIVDLKPTVSFNVCMLSSRERKLSPAAKKFLDFIEASHNK